MMKCPLCNHELNQYEINNHFCSECGSQFKDADFVAISEQKGGKTSMSKAEEVEIEYEINERNASNTKSGAATFFNICGVLEIIGGIILAIQLGKTTETYGYYSSFKKVVYNYNIIIPIIVSSIIIAMIYFAIANLLNKAKRNEMMNGYIYESLKRIEVKMAEKH